MVKKAIKKAFEGVDRDLLLNELKSSENTISQIVNGHLKVSAERAWKIQQITKGKVKAALLRPDVFGKN